MSVQNLMSSAKQKAKKKTGKTLQQTLESVWSCLRSFYLHFDTNCKPRWHRGSRDGNVGRSTTLVLIEICQQLRVNLWALGKKEKRKSGCNMEK